MAETRRSTAKSTAKSTAESTAESMRSKLVAAFAPEHLEVIDESEAHRGHGGWREGGGTHFRVVMRAAVFEGMSRVERSRAVHAALADDLEGGVHALALELSGVLSGSRPGRAGPPAPES